MFKILIDTSVLLELPKDPDQKIVGVLEELVEIGELFLIVPRTVLTEFRRNKARILNESSKSLSGIIKRVKELVDKHGDPGKKKTAVDQLNDINYKIPSLGEVAAESVNRIEKLLKKFPVIEITDDVKLRAAQRAIEGKAPFHSGKNSFNDAVIIEIYSDCVRDRRSAGTRFAFVTHNTKDFSDPIGNKKHPHPDFLSYFSRSKSLYFIKLTEAVQRFRPEEVTDIMIQQEGMEKFRSVTEIIEAENELFEKVWYNRYQNRLYRIKIGKEKIADPSTGPVDAKIQQSIFEQAGKNAKKIEKKYGVEKLMWDDFEWGMINGKLSALRWVFGDDWDNLDT